MTGAEDPFSPGEKGPAQAGRMRAWGATHPYRTLGGRSPSRAIRRMGPLSRAGSQSISTEQSAAFLAFSASRASCASMKRHRGRPLHDGVLDHLLGCDLTLHLFHRLAAEVGGSIADKRRGNRCPSVDTRCCMSSDDARRTAKLAALTWSPPRGS